MPIVNPEFWEDCSKYIRPEYKKKGVTPRQRTQFRIRLSDTHATYRCPVCFNIITDKNYHVGHVIPESKGGANSFENYVAMCPHCNEVMQNNHFSPDDISDMIQTNEDLQTLLFFGGKNNEFYRVLQEKGFSDEFDIPDRPIPFQEQIG